MKRVTSHSLRRLFLGGLAMAAFTTQALAWWNDDWQLRKAITLDAGETGVSLGGDTGATVVLVRLHDGNFQFPAALPDGGDVRFVAGDDKTPLTYHFEKYDSLLDEAFAWVKIPGLKAGTKTKIWLYYGNPAAPRVEDAKGTYDEAVQLVYHFSGTGAPVDSSKNTNNAVGVGLPTTGSLIGAGQRMLGSGAIHIPFSESLKRASGDPFTWSAWVKPTGDAARAVVFYWGDRDNGLEIGLASGVPYFEIHDGAASARSAPGAPVATGAWKHLAVVSGQGTTTLYVDGAPYASLDQPVPSLTDGALLGADTTGGNGLIGEIDEMQIAKTGRTAAWVKFAAISQSGSAESQKLVVMGTEENSGHGGESPILEHLMLFVDIGHNMQFDGWVVVFCCLLMAIVCWSVAIRKFMYLGRIQKGSEEFLQQWKLVSADLTVLDHTNSDNVKSLGGVADNGKQALIQQSPIYHLYHIGSEEIRHRLQNKSGFYGLSTRSIQAIKASLDAGLTRELHRINDGLVYLTISIAGGPYVGLLGTVIGVMITFAVIAKSGEVEVNSIAPGIAGALLATVAGLLVAIPALFIYSYLNNRIKDVVSNMQLFIDEFVAKMAEFYPDSAERTQPGEDN
jgi:biopolymer transport protein ExbB